MVTARATTGICGQSLDEVSGSSYDYHDLKQGALPGSGGSVWEREWEAKYDKKELVWYVSKDDLFGKLVGEILHQGWSLGSECKAYRIRGGRRIDLKDGHKWAIVHNTIYHKRP